MIEPWKIKVVMTSLPFLADSQTIKHALEQSNGDVNNAVSMLIEAEETGSISSTQESSSVERDYDSDDDQIWGPNKRAAKNKLNRGVRNLMRDAQKQRTEMAARLAANDGSQESVSHAVENLEIPDSKDNSPAPFDDEDEWVPSGSEITSDSGAQRGPTRLKINVHNAKIGKTPARGQGSRATRVPPMRARDLKTAKKAQQKEARKLRAQQASKNGAPPPGQEKLPILTRDQHNSSPAPGVVEGGMKTLYI